MQEKDRRKWRVEEMAVESGGKYWRRRRRVEERDEECGGEVKWRRMSRIVKEREEKYRGGGAGGEMRNRVLETEGGGE